VALEDLYEAWVTVFDEDFFYGSYFISA